MLNEAIAAAIEAMSWIDYRGLSERSALFRAARQLAVDRPDALRMAYRIITETQRNLSSIDFMITRVIQEEQFEKLTHGAQNVLRIITYAKHWERFSDSDLSQVLAAARRAVGWRDLASLEYNFGRMMSARYLLGFDQMSELERVAAQYSHPQWFVERCLETLGRTFTIEMLRRNQKPATRFLIVNPLRAKAAGVRSSLKREGAVLEPILPGWLFKATEVKKPLPATRAYARGALLQVDKSSVFAVMALDPKARSKIWDACAAPGIKTSIIAMQTNDKANVLASDFSPARVRQGAGHLASLGVSRVHWVVCNARNALPFHSEYDRVLVDPPCSNSGVFMRTPSARWRMTLSRLQGLVRLQRDILWSASRAVASGGVLVYSTCSVLPEEGEMVVESFLRTHPEFRLEAPELPEGLHGLRGMKDARRLYPHINDCNGFFIARLVRA